MTTIAHRVFDVLADLLQKRRDDISGDQNLIADLLVDSLDAVELIMDLEDEFNLLIQDHEVENIRTVNDLISFVDMKMNRESS